MSGRRLPVSVAPEAQRDYDEILLYGVRTWGVEQAARYRDALDRAIDGLADYPEIGPRRDDLFLGCRIRPVEHHVLYYRITADMIEVLNILHERADPRRRLLK